MYLAQSSSKLSPSVVCNSVCSELLTISQSVQSEVCHDVFRKLHSVTRIPSQRHNLVAVYFPELVLVVLDGDDLLYSGCVSAKHHEVLAFDTHQVLHDGQLQAAERLGYAVYTAGVISAASGELANTTRLKLGKCNVTVKASSPLSYLLQAKIRSQCYFECFCEAMCHAFLLTTLYLLARVCTFVPSHFSRSSKLIAHNDRRAFDSALSVSLLMQGKPSRFTPALRDPRLLPDGLILRSRDLTISILACFSALLHL